MMQFGLLAEDIAKINRVFSDFDAIESVYVYGSRAKGNFKNSSDIDLTLVEQTMTFSDFLALENQLDDLLLPYKIDLSQKRKIANVDLLAHIDRVGQLFYTKEKL
ncbi:Predicted nucleotidyltransferase [Flavobacterium sp. 9R]|uniref:nucleotidyltransferase domain-containing protein n=1 Tax=Flavobacterium sp. 9R TaxID=2653143 RepID=UPI0012F1BA28|nr:nucleotidyltransferase domain-containing protein [Flavobacterium sp. 9R]VXA96982.1 Predicted nucleotidyltransferase [Flavobacterium sp. 9R]